MGHGPTYLQEDETLMVSYEGINLRMEIVVF